MKDRIIFFLLGSVIGSATTFIITKKVKDKELETKLRLEVDNRVNAEIAQIKAEYKNDGKKEAEDKPLVSPSSPTKKPDLMDYYKETAKRHHYTNYSDHDGEEKDDEIRIIPSSEIPYGIEEEIIRYKYWADGALTDSTDEPLTEKEIQNSCGHSFEDFFGKDSEEPDIVYVKRGEKYYEITMDAREFEDTIE